MVAPLIASAAFVPPPPAISLTPACGPPAFAGGPGLTYSISVSGVNFIGVNSSSGGTVDPILFADQVVASVIVPISGSFVATIHVTRRVPGTYPVTVLDPKSGKVTKNFQVPCPLGIRLVPSCGVPAAVGAFAASSYVIAVTGSGFSSRFRVALFFAAQPRGFAETNTSGEFTASITVPAQPAGTYEVIARDAKTQSEASALFGVPCLAPSLVFTPPLGPPGFVTSLLGAGFPPNAEISLSWKGGFPVQVPIVVADASGTFRLAVLIFPRDELGPRVLRALSMVPDAFPGVQAAFLVVPGPGQPAGYSVAVLEAREALIARR